MAATTADLQAYATQAAQRAGVDPAIFARMISQESGWNASAQSSAGALGIAQFMPGTAQDMGINPMNPYQSLDAAARYLKSGLDQFGSYPLALAAYNAGAGAVQQYGGVPPFAETQNYVKTILGGLGDTVTTSTPTPTPTDSSAIPWAGMASQAQDRLNQVEANRPTQDQFVAADGTPDAASYQLAFTTWSREYSSAQSDLLALNDAKNGLAKLPDGTVVATGSLTPSQQAAVDQSNQNVYTSMLHSLGMDKYSLIKDTNSTLTSDFTNKVNALNAGINLDSHDLASAQANLTRWMNAQNIAQQDVQDVQAAQDQAQKYGTTDGQTSFTAADLGGGVSALAAQAGIPTGTPILRYPGFQNEDPMATRSAALASMGMSAAPPLLPSPTVSAAQVPQAPPLMMPPPYSPPPAPPLAVPGSNPAPTGIATPSLLPGMTDLSGRLIDPRALGASIQVGG